MKKEYLLAGSAAALILIIAGGVIFLKSQNRSSLPALNFVKKQLNMRASYAAIGEKAFDLKNASNSKVQADSRSANSTAESFSKAISSIAPTNLTSSAGMGGSASSVAPAPAMDKMISMPCRPNAEGGCILPEPIRYEYVYKGEEIKIPDNKMAVLKRVRGFGQTLTARDIFGNLSFDTINLNKFDNARADNVSLMEDRDYGYSINISFSDGSLSFYQNWNKWPQPYNNCKDQACYDSLRIKESDIPADDVLIGIANQFLGEYGIKVDGYGAPEVQNDWKIAYETTSDKANYYFPDMMNVVYPLMLDGKTVYDEGGNKAGIIVSVSIRDKKVSSVYNLAAQNYQTSLYEVETDQAKLLEMAKNGGGVYYGNGGPMPLAEPAQPTKETRAVKVVEVEIGTPVLGLVRTWSYKDGQSDELYAPALIFPIAKKPEGAYYWQKNIIVPLVKEIIERNDGITLMKTDAGVGAEASSGSAGIVTNIKKALPSVVTPAPSKK